MCCHVSIKTEHAFRNYSKALDMKARNTKRSINDTRRRTPQADLAPKRLRTRTKIVAEFDERISFLRSEAITQATSEGAPGGMFRAVCCMPRGRKVHFWVHLASFSVSESSLWMDCKFQNILAKMFCSYCDCPSRFLFLAKSCIFLLFLFNPVNITFVNKG